MTLSQPFLLMASSIAFRSEREGGGIFVMGATGESVKRLTDFGFNPAWSPDGKDITCADEGPVDWANRQNPNSRVWIVNIATGDRRQVTREDSTQANWSPHGYRIAYQARRNTSQRDIITISVNGGDSVCCDKRRCYGWKPSLVTRRRLFVFRERPRRQHEPMASANQ